MKKVNIFSQKRFRSIRSGEMAVCTQWFTEPDFYFFTKRPDSLIPGNINAILSGILVFVNERDKPVGLLRYDPEFFGNINSSVCEFRFADKTLYENSMAERLFYSFLHHIFFQSNRFITNILVRVYGFDALTVDFFRNIKVEPSVCLKEQSFKNGRFHDSYIYCISRNQYLADNNLKG